VTTATLALIRWFNLRFPWNQPKSSLTKWAAKRLPPTPGTSGERACTGVQGGLTLVLDLSVPHDQRIYLNSYQRVELSVLRRVLKPGDVYVDCGANIGVFALVAWQCVGPTGKVIAFEPLPRAREKLCHHVEMNHAGNITVYPLGVWDKAETLVLYDFADGTITQASLGKREDMSVGAESRVRVVRLDDYVEPPVKLLKIDVEGAELAALRGAERLLGGANPPHLLLELNTKTSRPFGYHPLELVDLVLKTCPGYRMHLLDSKHCRRVGRDDLARRFERAPNKSQNVWFEAPDRD